MLCPFALVNEGLRKAAILRLRGVNKGLGGEMGQCDETYSAAIAFGGSRDDCLEIGAGESSIMLSSSSSTVGVVIGVGEVTSMSWFEKGVLCGSGDTSMVSIW